MLTLHDASLDDILECMRTHRTRCGYAFHDQCREWVILCQWYTAKGGHGLQSDAFDHLSIVNERMYVITLDSADPVHATAS